MADLNAFAYTPGHSSLHGMDPRFKLACLLVMSLAMVQCGAWTLLGLFALAGLGAAAGRVPLLSMLASVRFFFVLLLFIILVRGLAAPGPGLSPDGLIQGAVISGRLLVILIASAVFVATTRAGSVFSAVRWFLKPVPFVSEVQVAMMLSLMVRFVPVLLDEVGKVVEAQKARGLELRKNPVRRMVLIVPPLLDRVFCRAQDLALALTARNFGPHPTLRGLHAKTADWIALAGVLTLSVGLRLFD